RSYIHIYCSVDSLQRRRDEVLLAPDASALKRGAFVASQALDRALHSGIAVAPPSVMIAHHFTIDLEEYFQVSAFASRVARCDWERFESRVNREVGRLLELLAQHNARATFFVLGGVAQRPDGLIPRIVRAGHELGSSRRGP